VNQAVLIQAGKKGGCAPKHQWTDKERAIVRRDYMGTNASARQIAEKLGVTQHAVKGQCAKMGILQPKSPPWTKKELDQLWLLIHKHSIPQIAKKLHRSTNAVKIKATRLKMQLRTRDDWYTKREVCEILGVDHKKVQTWIDCGALIATWHNRKKPSQKGMAMWHITNEALRSFIIRHSDELLGRNVDIQQIVFIVTGTFDTYRMLGGSSQ